jgi:hypothetical protein
LKFQKKKGKTAKKKKAVEKSEPPVNQNEGIPESASLTGNSMSVGTRSIGDTGPVSPGNVSPLPLDLEVDIAAGAREILSQQTDDLDDLLQEAEPSLVSGVSHLSLDKDSSKLMTDGLVDNRSADRDRSWVNQQLNELQSENDELRLSQIQMIEGKDREIMHLKEQVSKWCTQFDYRVIVLIVGRVASKPA